MAASRPNLKSVVALAKEYEDTQWVNIGLYDDGSFSVGSDFPDDARFVKNVLLGRDRRKSIRKALDELDVIVKESSNRRVSTKENVDESE